MSRRIGIYDGPGTTAYRSVVEFTTSDGRLERRFQGLYDTAAPARAHVARVLGQWAQHPVDGPEERVTFDAWVEPVSIVNHPGVRLGTDGWHPALYTAERLDEIARIAENMIDAPPSIDTDEWARAVVALARGEMMPEDVEWG